MEFVRTLPVHQRDVHDAPLGTNFNEFDVLISDVNDSYLACLAEELGVDVSKNTGGENGPTNITGTIFGATHRVFFPLHVRLQQETMRPGGRQILFLFGTGAPATYLRAEEWERWGISIPENGQRKVIIGGIVVSASVSKDNFHNVNLLGQNWCVQARAQVHIDYSEARPRVQFSVPGVS